MMLRYLSGETLVHLHTQRPAGVETEILVYGRLPLAYSARCFTARAHYLPKDSCQYCCLDYPDGLTLLSQNQRPFLTLNGIQTQSAYDYNLLLVIPELTRLSVEVLRISPDSKCTNFSRSYAIASSAASSIIFKNLIV